MMLQLLMEGNVKGKRSIGRRMISLLRNLRVWLIFSQIFGLGVYKVKTAMLISNI